MSGREMGHSRPSQQQVARGAAAGLPVPLRIPLLVLAFVSLFAGILAGLARLGPLQTDLALDLAAVHGPLMICGFLGTVIGLERAVALGRVWAFASPLLTALGSMALIASPYVVLPETTGPGLFVLGSLVLCLANLAIMRIRLTDDTAVIALGGLAWTAGNILWVFGADLASVVTLWASFLVLTIAGERLELSRLMPPTRLGRRLFAPVIALLILGTALAAASLAFGELLFAAALVALALWLMRYDVARRTVRTEKLARFIAVCLLSGYGWLAFSGLLILAGGGLAANAMVYDAALHGLFLGFVFSMIFGHAPVILPAVTTLNVPYRTVFYVHLAVLHLSVALRVIGDLSGSDIMRSLGGSLNAAAIVLFVLATVSSAAIARAR